MSSFLILYFTDTRIDLCFVSHFVPPLFKYLNKCDSDFNIYSPCSVFAPNNTYVDISLEIHTDAFTTTSSSVSADVSNGLSVKYV